MRPHPKNPHANVVLPELTRKLTKSARLSWLIALRGSAGFLAGLAIFGFNPSSAIAANGTWTGGSTTANWNDQLNWAGQTVPGEDDGNPALSNTDVATFNAAIPNASGSSALTPIIIDSPVENIFGINFTGTPGNYFIGSTTGNSLLLTSGGVIQVTSGMIAAATETINAPLVIEGGALTINNASAAGTLDIGGAITGGSAGAGTFLFLNGANTTANTVSGNISNGLATSLSLTGSAGTWILSGSNSYTGATNVDTGSMTIAGSLGSSGSNAGAINEGISAFTVGSTLTFAPGSITYVSAINQNQGTSGTEAIKFNGGTVNVSGNISLNNGAGGGTGLATLTSGTVNTNTITIGRDVQNFGPNATNGVLLTHGLVVNGGVLNVASNISIGVPSTNSSANMSVLSGGIANVNGVIQISGSAATRYSVLGVGAGGLLNANGGIILGGTAAAGVTMDDEFLMTGGTSFVSGIAFAGNYSTASGNEVVNILNGTLYLGAGGITTGTGNSNRTVSFTSGSGASIIGATASWSSSLGFNLGSGAGATFLLSGTDGTPETITVNGQVTGSGALNLTGTGAFVIGSSTTNSGQINIGTGSTLSVINTADLGAAGQFAGAVSNSGSFNYASSSNTTFNGAVSGTGAFTNNGTGTLFFGNSFTGTGPLMINSGGMGVSGTGQMGTAGNYSGNITDSGVFNASNTSVPQTLSGAISGTGAVSESGVSILSLSGANTYSGATTISSGTLALLSGGSLGNTAINITGGTFLASAGASPLQIGSGNASLTLGVNGLFSMQDGGIGTAVLNGNAAGTALTLLGSGTTTNGLAFDVGSTGADFLNVPTGGFAFTGTSPDNILLDALATAAPGASSVPIISVPNGILSLADFNLLTTSLSFNSSVYAVSLTLGGAGGNSELFLTLTPTGTANYYFNGTQGQSWSSIGNFSTTNTGGAAQTAPPGTSSNVFLTADTASAHAANYENETIDGVATINSLSFTGTDSNVGNTPGATNSITLGTGTGTSPLTITAVSAFSDANGRSYAAGRGLVVQAGSAAHTINANINLGNSQRWEIDNSPSNPLTMNGIIGDGSSLDGLIKTGSGTLILNGANTYDGGTTINNGLLQMGPLGTLASTGTLTVTSGTGGTGAGTFDLAGTTQTVGGLSDGGSSTGTITNSVNNGTLNVNDLNSSTFSGTITDSFSSNGASLALAFSGTANMTLSGSNNFTGGVTLNSGTVGEALALTNNLTIANNYALGNPTSLNLNAGLNLNTVNSSDIANVFFTSANPNVASINTVGTGISNVILGNATSGSATTLFLGGGGAAQDPNGLGDVIGATISDRSSVKAGAIGNLTVYGGALVVLQGANTFTGVTIVTGSNVVGGQTFPTELQLKNSLALQNSIVDYDNQGGVIDVPSLQTLTFGGLEGAENFNLDNDSLQPITLTIGSNTSSYAGSLTGDGILQKVGSGTFTLTGTSFNLGGIVAGTLPAGATVSDAGALIVAGGLGNSGTAYGAIVSNGGLLDFNNGANVFAPSLSNNSVLASQTFINSGAVLNISGALAANANNGTLNGLLEINGGSVTAGSVTVGRGNTIITAPGLIGTTADGLYVTSGTLNDLTTLTVGGNTPSTANFRQDGGSVTVGGTVFVDNNGSSRLSDLVINGGTFTDNDTSGVGIRLGGLTDAGPEDAELLLNGGTLSTPAVTMGAAAQTTGTNYFIAAAGNLNIGAGGIVAGGGTGTTEVIDFGFAGVGNALTVTATSTWSEALPIVLTNGTTGNVAPTFVSGSGVVMTLNGALSGVGGVNISGTNGGTVVFGGVNAYAGLTTISGGRLMLTNIGALASTSGVTFAGGALEYSNGNTTDYSALFLNSTSPIAINTNGQAITFASSFNVSNTGGLTVADAAGGGSLTLTAPNTYSAPTTIRTGAALTLTSNASLGQTAISVASGGAFTVLTGNGTNTQLGSTAASLSLAAGASLSLTGSGIGTVTLNNVNAGTGTVLSLLGTSSSTDNITFAVGGGGISDLVVNNGTIAFSGTGGTNISFLALLGSSPTSLTQIPLIIDPNGTFAANEFNLKTTSISVGGSVYNITLGVTPVSSGDELFATLNKVASAGYFFTGVQSASWNNILNFATDHTGAFVQSGTLGSTDNITLVADNAAGSNYKNETIDGNLTINSLSFTGTDSSVGDTPAATAGITLSSGTATAPLTILAATAFGDVNNNGYQNTGVVVQAGSASHTLATNVNLGNNQIWEIDNSPANPLIVTGTIGDGSTLDALTKSGSGTMLLETAETYDGGTIINGGRLQLGLSNALLTTPTVTVSGSGTLDLDGNNQTLTNLADGGVSTGVITTSTGASTLTLTNTNAITFRGGLRDTFFTNGASLSLVLSGTSVVTLSGSSRYTGSTTLNGGTLVAANDHALGSGTSPNAGLILNPSLTGTVTTDFTSSNPTVGYIQATGTTGGAVIILGNGSAGTATTLNITGGSTAENMVYNGTIGDLITTSTAAIGSLNLTGGTLTLNGSDTYSGTTTVGSAGTLIFGSSAALQDSTLIVSSSSGVLNFGTLTAVTLGGLAGSGNFAPNLAVTFGGNNASQTFSGALTGTTSSFLKLGSGTETFSGVDTYAGTTVLGAGVLNITNTLGTSGSVAGAITSATGTLNINNNASVTTASLSQNGGAFINISGTSVVNVLGNLGANANNASVNGNIVISAGATVNANTVTVGRDGNNLGQPVITGGAPTGDGLYVNGGHLVVSSGIFVGGTTTTTNSSAVMRLDNGSVTVNGPAQVNDFADKRISILDISGGTFTDTDTSGIGMAVGGNTPGSSGSNTEVAEISIRGGTVNTPEITVSGTAQTDGLSTLFIDGGTINIGAGGIAEPAGSTFAAVTLGFASSTVAPTLTATSSWSSSAPMTLANSSTSSGSLTPTFQTSPTGVANTITLSGNLSGGGGITQSGSGTLVLSGSDSFSGITSVSGSAGRLIVSGSLTASTSATVAVGGHLEVDGSFNQAGTINDSGFLNGNGVVGAVNVNTGGTLAPGRTLGLTAPANLTANGNVIFSSTGSSTFSIRLGVASATDSDQLTVGNSGAVTLNDATLKLTLGSAFQTPTVGFIYVLINGGASATGSGTDVFNGEQGSGSLYVDSQGDAFGVYYGVSATDTTVAGSDVDLLYIGPVPEPSTWAEMLAGAGVFLVWRRRSRRSQS